SLRDLVLMMREDQIDAPGVDIERLPQVLDRHHGALNVPAGPAWTEFSIPKRLAVLRRFPKHEIPRIGLFVLIHVDARPGAHAAEVAVGELAVLGELGDTVVNRSITLIGVALVR